MNLNEWGRHFERIKTLLESYALSISDQSIERVGYVSLQSVTEDAIVAHMLFHKVGGNETYIETVTMSLKQSEPVKLAAPQPTKEDDFDIRENLYPKNVSGDSMAILRERLG